MIRLISGRAKSGKTAVIMNEINERVKRGEKRMLLLVPEQYSHEAERELCSVCGDEMSLHVEVLSFTRLSRRVADMVGGARKFLDDSGRVLALSRALEAVSSRLKVYGAARRSTELQASLMGILAELKMARLSAQTLHDEAEKGDDALHDKLADLSLILGAYDAVTGQGMLDPGDRMLVLAEGLERGLPEPFGAVYIDGFTDFTAQEREVVRALSYACGDLTLSLTMEGLYDESEIFDASRKTAIWLKNLAEDKNEQFEQVSCERRSDDSALAVFEKYLFSYSSTVFENAGEISLYRGDSISDECELAAAKVIELVSNGCRYRDIAIAIRGFDSYRTTLECTFERYGVPLFTAVRSDIMQKPLPLLLSSAIEAVTGGFEYDDMFSYLKTGLAGLSSEETDLLENYCITWSVRGNVWFNDWVMHPEGYNAEFDEKSRERLAYINALRAQVIAPLKTLYERSRSETSAAGHARALADFFEEIKLPSNLKARADALEEQGDAQKAAEYSQLWEIIVSALEQGYGVLAEAEMSFEHFGKLYRLMLSQCDVGSIPVSLDRVSAGEMDRMRRRNIKHLFILGASDQRLPSISEGGGVFSSEERRRLAELGLDLGGTADNELSREMNIIYNCITLPRESLLLSFCSTSDDGSAALPSFVMTRAKALFDAEISHIDLANCRSHSKKPAIELASAALHGEGGMNAAAFEYFSEIGESDYIVKLNQVSKERGNLTKSSVKALYGERLRLSASRADKFISCKFAFFLQYGLRAKPRKAAGFNPPEIGTFMHYVLERVSKQLRAEGGFENPNKERVDELTDKFVDEYVSERLNDFQDKSQRFIYLFKRLTSSVRSVVWDMVLELSRSDFEPLDFELSFSGEDGTAVTVGDSPENSAELTGIVDRVDGWVHDGKLYIRVMDYKTGRKKFDLSDVWNGMGLQMLMYLFALGKTGQARYNMEVVPAGVMYIPARDKLVSAKGDMHDEELAKEKAKALKRSGLILADDAVIEAMEHGEEKRYIPVSFKKGVPSGDALASAEQLGQLSRYIDELLMNLAKELKDGNIKADPYYRANDDYACQWCEYFEACYFEEGRDRWKYMTKVKPGEVWHKLASKEAENDGKA